MWMIDIIKLCIPLYGKKKQQFESLKNILDPERLRLVKRYAKLGMIQFADSRLGVSRILAKNDSFISIDVTLKGKDKIKGINKINSEIEDNFRKLFFRDISKDALNIIPKFIAPNIIGFDDIKKAAALQLFADEDHFHILLLGDPGTGKTDIIRSVADLSPISSYGLGSGTSGVGLTLTMKGNDIIKGLLPKADGGIAAIDELNLMKKEDLAGLYNAMEKGFVSLDKGSKHIREDANVSVIATANPKNDKFRAKTISRLKEQLPFDPALLTRFHLVFLLKKPGKDEFKNIASHIVKGSPKINEDDIKFIRQYISFASEQKVDFPKDLETEIVKFSEYLKENEKRFLVEVNPRMIIGIIRMSKAIARMELRNKVLKEDLSKVIDIYKRSLDVKSVLD